MAHDSKWWLVCYDIRDAKRLRKTAKHLEGYGHRMQYSVFRCWLSGEQMHRLRWELTDLLRPDDDVLMIPLCEHCVRGLEGTYSTEKQIRWPDQPPSHRVL